MSSSTCRRFFCGRENPQRRGDVDYHFQKDVKGADNIMSLLIYIKNHDDFRCKMIANVENIPRRTKKQHILAFPDVRVLRLVVY